MKFKSFIFKILALFLGFSAKAQYSEVGVFAGGTNFIGDVGDYGIHLPKGYAGGIFYQYNFNYHWAVRAQFNYGLITNGDSLSSFDSRVNRNLDFSSEIWEASLMARFNFRKYKPGTKYWHTPYLLGGFGMFSFDPYTEYQGETYKLRPLGTEGQRTSESSDGFYPEASSFLIFGLGYKWAVGDFTSLTIESTFRNTNTDYLDDVSKTYADPGVIEEERGPVAAALSDRSLSETDKTGYYRGNPDNNDWYIFTGVTLQFKFGELIEKCASFVGQ